LGWIDREMHRRQEKAWFEPVHRCMFPPPKHSDDAIRAGVNGHSYSSRIFV
jgi:hypothetical protein